MPGGRTVRVLPGMRSEQPGGPQLVGITQLLGLAARQCHQPSFRRGRDDGVASRTRTVIERLDYPSSAVRSKQRVTVCCVTPIVRATAYGSCK
jgi:hypothetical protein